MTPEERLKRLGELQRKNMDVVALKQKAEGSAELMLAFIKTDATDEVVEAARQRSIMQWEAWLDESAQLGIAIRDLHQRR